MMGWKGGRKLSPEHRENTGKAMLGHEVSPETRRKIRESLRGKKPSNLSTKSFMGY